MCPHPLCRCDCRVAGALYGRALGVGMLSIWRSIEGTDYPVGTIWDWLDPGVISVIGSASMLGGVTRLGITSTVLMVSLARGINPNVGSFFITLLMVSF